MTDLTLPGSPEFVAPTELKGFDRGYNQVADVLVETKDGRNLNALWREFQASLRLFNQERDALLSLLTYNVNEPVESVLQPMATEDFEEASEFGEPKGIRGGKPFSMGYAFKWWDIGIRYTWMFLAEAAAAQVESLNAQVLEAGNRLYFNQALRRLFNPANEVASIEGANYNVYALYNADGTVPPPYRSKTFLGSHTHYVTSGAAVIDQGDLVQIEDDFYDHGYRLTQGYSLILMMNRAQATTVRSFKVATGARWDFLPSPVAPGGGLLLPAGQIVVGVPTGQVQNQIGTYGPFLVVEDDYIPAGYVLAFASGGEQNLGNLIGIREHAQPGLRGLQLVKGRDNDYPLTESFYRFGFGTGVRHRGAGYVMQITAAGAYAAPAAYA